MKSCSLSGYLTSNINSLSVSVTSVFSKAACYANPEAEKNVQDPKDKILNAFS